MRSIGNPQTSLSKRMTMRSIGNPPSFTYFCSMKHSQTIGIILCIFLMFCTTQPMVIIDSKNLIITGWQTAGTSFGKPGMFFAIFGGLAALFFALPFIWAKRFNLAFASLILAWSFRNFMVLSTCQMGDCPRVQWPLYACIIISFSILIMTFLPKIKIPKSTN